MNKAIFHPAARRDLEEIWEFIARDNVGAADRLVGSILASVEALAQYPRRGHQRRELTSRPLRFLVHRSFVVVYAPEAKPLQVIAILHGHRNPRVLAALLSDRTEDASRSRPRDVR